MQFRVIGHGRAGGSFLTALEAGGWHCVQVLGREDDLRPAAASGADVTLLAVPDGAIGDVAATIEPGPSAIIHLSGATTLEPLKGHLDAGSVHPLVSLPDPVTGARALDGSYFALAATTPRARSITEAIVAALNGTAFDVPDEQRAGYHATAATAANHLVALCAQVERLAASSNVPAKAFWPLMAGVLDNVATNGARASLTGPVARGDWQTVADHLAAIPAEEHDRYLVFARAAAELAGTTWPDELTGETP